MGHKHSKVTVNRAEIALTTFDKWNVKAKGGHRYAIECRQWLGDELIREAGYHYKKNHAQHVRKRNYVLTELIKNNFTAGKSACITLTFDPSIVKFEELGSVKKRKEMEKLRDELYDRGLERIRNPNAEQLTAEERAQLRQINEWEKSEKPTPSWRMQYTKRSIAIEIAEELFSGKTVEKTQLITNEGAQNLELCHREFKKFIQRMNYRYKNFKYVAVFNRQPISGNWHYHVICNIVYISYLELQSIWGNGRVYIDALKDETKFNKTTNYCRKNMWRTTRMWPIDSSLDNNKAYLASKGLNRGIVFRSWREDERDEFYGHYRRIEDFKKSQGTPRFSRTTSHTHEITETNSYELESGSIYTSVHNVIEMGLCTCKYYRIESNELFPIEVAQKRKKK